MHMRGKSIKFTSVLSSSSAIHRSTIPSEWSKGGEGLLTVSKRLGPIASQVTHLAIDLLFQMETTCQLMT